MTTSARFTLANRRGRRIVGLIDYPPGDGPVERTRISIQGVPAARVGWRPCW